MDLPRRYGNEDFRMGAYSYGLDMCIALDMRPELMDIGSPNRSPLLPVVWSCSTWFLTSGPPPDR